MKKAKTPAVRKTAEKKTAKTAVKAPCKAKCSACEISDPAVKTAIKVINKSRKSEAKAKPAVKAEPKAETKKAKGITLSVKLGSGKNVFIAGSFNNWDPKAMQMAGDENGVYSITLNLDPGIYEYKFVIDGVWTLDPDPERDWTQNGLGTLNSVLRIG